MRSLVFLFLFLFSPCFSLKIDRVIVSTDTNPMYMDFWPIVAEAWEKLVGIRPTLAFIAPADVEIDESLGDVIRFEPIEGVSTVLQAQVVRHFLPLYFKDEGCLISDIDMIPLSKSFFIDTVADIPDDCFVVYRSAVALQYKEYVMCYNAAKGSTFGEVFGIDDIADIPEMIKRLAEQFNHKWQTDQLALYYYLRSWEHFEDRCALLQHPVEKRVDRINWKYDIEKLKSGYYIDSHMLRPYKRYKMHNDRLCGYLGFGPLAKNKKVEAQ